MLRLRVKVHCFTAFSGDLFWQSAPILGAKEMILVRILYAEGII